MDSILAPAEVKQAIKNTFMSRHIFILATCVIFTFLSALSLIYIKSLYRHYFIQLQEIEAKRDALHTEWTQLLLEESTWAAHARIAKIATTQLDMKDPDPDEIQIIIPKTDAVPTVSLPLSTGPTQ